MIALDSSNDYQSSKALVYEKRNIEKLWHAGGSVEATFKVNSQERAVR